jgi:hypothetical protein
MNQVTKSEKVVVQLPGFFDWREFAGNAEGL